MSNNKNISEHKYVLIRTQVGNSLLCHSFMTKGYNDGSILDSMFPSNRVVDEITLGHGVGGQLKVFLKTWFSNGVSEYPLEEVVIFRPSIVVGIEVFTEFDNTRETKI